MELQESTEVNSEKGFHHYTDRVMKPAPWRIFRGMMKLIRMYRYQLECPTKYINCTGPGMFWGNLRTFILRLGKWMDHCTIAEYSNLLKMNVLNVKSLKKLVFQKMDNICPYM